MTKPVFFKSPTEWRRWLAGNHRRVDELWVGFHKRKTGKPSLTWPESVDEALCYGWIDGLRKSIDADAYMIRFTPRRPTSVWSAVNVRRVKELTRSRRMRAAGRKAFAALSKAKTAIYSFEQRKDLKLPKAYVQRFRARPGAWEFFNERPPWYQRTATFLVLSAKREETRLRRLDRLINDSANRRPLRELAR
jgi:uncharacterized protein YdeI (YjbR/CyaY-like superfamily)